MKPTESGQILVTSRITHCDRYRDRYSVAIMLDEKTVRNVPRDVPKLENYDEIRSHLYKFSFNELLEAENSFLEKIINFDEVRAPNF